MMWCFAIPVRGVRYLDSSSTDPGDTADPFTDVSKHLMLYFPTRCMILHVGFCSRACAIISPVCVSLSVGGLYPAKACLSVSALFVLKRHIALPARCAV